MARRLHLVDGEPFFAIAGRYFANARIKLGDLEYGFCSWVNYLRFSLLSPAFYWAVSNLSAHLRNFAHLGRDLPLLDLRSAPRHGG